MKAFTYLCDKCKRRRGEANHWYILTIGEASLIVATWDSATEEEIEKAHKHLCGDQCLQACISELLTKRATWQKPVRINAPILSH